MSAIHASNVSFSYSSAVPIVDGASFDLGPGWTGLVGANGAGKSTLLSLIAGRQTPHTGSLTVTPAGAPPVLCEQRVDHLTDPIREFAWSWDRDAVRMRARLELEPDHLGRWQTLSPGERKRWQIGAALITDPSVLLLDEPTNHLDDHARNLLRDVIASYRGCGIVVSHDRSLLNELTIRTLRIVEGSIKLWNGPYDAAHDAWTARSVQLAERHARLRSEQKKLERRIADQRRKSRQKDAERIRERRAAGKHDLDTRGTAATYKHERGQKTGAQTVFSMTNSLERVSADLSEIAFEKELGGTIDFDFEPAPKEFLVRFDGPVVAGDQVLYDANVEVRRADRIRIAGANGSGKTSLLAAMLNVISIPADRVLSLEQETTASDSLHWLDTVRSLQPAQRGRVMSLVALLGADPESVLNSDQPSPGEARKIALALGLGTRKWFLALDEPTNHLDLPSIERLEAALRGFGGALVLITHDDALAAATTTTTWHVGSDGATVV